MSTIKETSIGTIAELQYKIVEQDAEITRLKALAISERRYSLIRQCVRLGFGAGHSSIANSLADFIAEHKLS